MTATTKKPWPRPQLRLCYDFEFYRVQVSFLCFFWRTLYSSPDFQDADRHYKQWGRDLAPVVPFEVLRAVDFE
jgi:hypothetical protein